MMLHNYIFIFSTNFYTLYSRHIRRNFNRVKIGLLMVSIGMFVTWKEVFHYISKVTNTATHTLPILVDHLNYGEF